MVERLASKVQVFDSAWCACYGYKRTGLARCSNAKTTITAACGLKINAGRCDSKRPTDIESIGTHFANRRAYQSD